MLLPSAFIGDLSRDIVELGIAGSSPLPAPKTRVRRNLKNRERSAGLSRRLRASIDRIFSALVFGFYASLGLPCHVGPDSKCRGVDHNCIHAGIGVRADEVFWMRMAAAFDHWRVSDGNLRHVDERMRRCASPRAFCRAGLRISLASRTQVLYHFHLLSAEVEWQNKCGCGGIGRRVRFRSVWGQPHEGSSPFTRTILKQQAKQ